MNHKYTGAFVPTFPDAPPEHGLDERLDTEPCEIQDRRVMPQMQDRPSAVYRTACIDCGDVFLYIVSVRDTMSLSRRCLACQDKANEESVRKEQVRAFAKRYAAESGVTLQFLHDNDQVVAVCDCDAPNCGGLQMARLEALQRDAEVLNQPVPEYWRLCDLGWPESRVKNADNG